MAVTFVALPRNYNLSVSATSGGSYTTVSGINNLTWAKDTNTTDLTVFDSQGVQVDAPVSAKLALEFEGLQAFTDSTLATRDPGQVILNAAATTVNPNGAVVYGKLTHATASGQMTFSAYVMLDETGGGNDDVMMIKGTLSLTDRPVGTGHFTNQLGSLT
jgi:hypothetical protein